MEAQLFYKVIRHKSSKRKSVENEWFSDDMHLGLLQETVQCDIMRLAAIRHVSIIRK